MNSAYLQAVRDASLVRRLGQVSRLSGLAIEASGPDVAIGELCRVIPRMGGAAILAEVVGLRPGNVTLMPYGSVQGLAAGCDIEAVGMHSEIGVGPALLGRVIDCFGSPLDDLPMPRVDQQWPLRPQAPSPMRRPRIEHVLETGIRAIDGLLTLGKGQRVGIFAGSGVGKSTLLGMIARHVTADVNVIALIGERGREVLEFIDKQLGEDGLRRSVVIVATADQPAAARVRATHAAIAISDYFRAQGKQVLLTMDSVTRFAMARREIGLSAGEPPTARGYTPSVFAELPELCERCGTAPSGGSITALLTVLVEGDDFNEPISDSLRAILDGHLVLSRDQAHRGQYPALDVLKSASRLMPDLCDNADRSLAQEAIRVLALLERSRQMIDLGAYETGSNLELDLALEKQAGLLAILRQQEGGVARAEAIRQLRSALGISAEQGWQT
ncbi:FliI/YscN family ATPase [Herbaspirillum sp. WGmk3]|uniref:FliI/YscN family ATPase n=1 Tax=Herbaspirillum sp. WGmk3 TaxID=2919925 RepID=UPI0020909B1E|nr:FliI/YscN family ATPase [Herbaspirillum sp. WGmk3]